MAYALGIPSPEVGRPFHCIIHSERKPSASLFKTSEGCILYHDFHAARHGDPKWLTLAQLRARKAGSAWKGQMTAPVHSVWKLLLLVEAGILPPATVKLPPLSRYSSPILRPRPTNAPHSHPRHLVGRPTPRPSETISRPSPRLGRRVAGAAAKT